MGMFDDVRCEVPLPDGYEGRTFQTKDFDCSMSIITITKDGRLWTDGHDWWRSEPAPRDLQFHGYFRFYDFDKERNWHEYLAKFTDGQLVGIEAIASGTEARSGETEGLDPKDDGPTGEAGDAQP